MIILDEFQQGSNEWYKQKLRLPSASHASEILYWDFKKKIPVISKSRTPYLERLAWEVITGTSEEGYKNRDMELGLELEDRARASYELLHGVKIKQVGCIMNDEKTFLVSPDGLVDEKKEGYEAKLATKRKIQTERLIKRMPPQDHYCQCQSSLMVTEYDIWNYHSYNFRFDPESESWIEDLPPLFLRIERNEQYISALKNELEKFNKDLTAMVDKFRRF